VIFILLKLKPFNRDLEIKEDFTLWFFLQWTTRQLFIVWKLLDENLAKRNLDIIRYYIKQRILLKCKMT